MRAVPPHQPSTSTHRPTPPHPLGPPVSKSDALERWRSRREQRSQDPSEGGASGRAASRSRSPRERGASGAAGPSGRDASGDGRCVTGEALRPNLGWVET